MECRVCGGEIQEEARFCPSCGSSVESVEEDAEILDAAMAEAQAAFESELESITEGEDESSPESGEDAESDSQGKRKSARERIRDMQEAARQTTEGAIKFSRKVGDSTSKVIKTTRDVSADVSHKVRKGTENAVEISRKVSDGTQRAVKKTKEVSQDVSEKVGIAVDKTKEFSTEAAVQAKKVKTGVGKAVKKTKETMDELGQVGVIITQRALDVVRASLRAVEIVDDYLKKSDSKYEVGNFITGVGIPPYLEIEFHKRRDKLTEEEQRILENLRKAGIPIPEIADKLSKPDAKKGSAQEEPDQGK